MKTKKPKPIKEVVKEALETIKILQENQPKDNLVKINKEIDKLWSEFTSDIGCININTQLSFNI